MSSPSKSTSEVGENATLYKAKEKFLAHLENVDTSNGPVNTPNVLKFHFKPEIEAELRAFVTEHGCSMETRIVSRAEQDKIDKRVKSCSQYTSFTVTPEAQREYRKNLQVPLTPTSDSVPKRVPKKVVLRRPNSNGKKPRAKTRSPILSRRIKQTPVERDTPESEDPLGLEQDDDDVVPKTASDPSSASDEMAIRIPIKKFDELCGRLASALLLLPTMDVERAVDCRDELVEVAHELRELRPASLKRGVSVAAGEGEGSRPAVKRLREA
ncbi:hypothetical protein R3P38DRAFT_2846612 [Favolaschia claudopus]|uniref:Uncharacterized protein n=1 Tax=Favolaschia claudopus TaxID=2862362 RepID=A0AAW0DV01_9AGAR